LEKVIWFSILNSNKSKKVAMIDVFFEENNIGFVIGLAGCQITPIEKAKALTSQTVSHFILGIW
jgi:hypothetical protein